MKHNLIFFLTGKTITVKETSENGDLKTIDVEGVEKYSYDNPDEFERFFEALKVDIYNIQDFSEEEFYVTVFDMDGSGKKVPKETLERFKGYLADCKNVAVANMDGISKNFMEETERLEKALFEKDEEIKSLNEKTEELEKLKTKHSAEITELENRHSSEMKKLKTEISETAEPVRTAIFAPCSGQLRFGKYETVKNTGNEDYTKRWEGKTDLKNLFYKESEEFCRIHTANATTSTKDNKEIESLGLMPISIFGQALKTVLDTIENNATSKHTHSVKTPIAGFVFTLRDNADVYNVKEGELIAVISSDYNDCDEKISKWLEKKQG